MKAKEQKYFIESLLSSKELFARALPVVFSDHFDPEYRPLLSYVLDYYGKNHTTPPIDLVSSKFDIELQAKQITMTEVNPLALELEQFARKQGLILAIYQGLKHIEDGEFSKADHLIDKAKAISLPTDMGVEAITDDDSYIRSLVDTELLYSTSLKGIDTPLSGGLARKQLTMFSANSGHGKSVVLANLAHYYARAGLDVLVVSLELQQKMIYLRMCAIVSGISTKHWKENIPDIVSAFSHLKMMGAGSLRIKKLRMGASASEIRSYLQQYILTYGKPPDVLVVDYLDQMNPNGGVKNIGIWEQDKQKTEELYAILEDYDMVGITASQQNREGLRNETPGQAVIAGGMSKVNTVDNYISIFMTDEMRMQGKMFFYYLKTRSSDGVGQMTEMTFDRANLQVRDSIDHIDIKIGSLSERKKIIRQLEDQKREADELFKSDIFDLPGFEDEYRETEASNRIKKMIIEEAEMSKKKDISDEDLEKVLLSTPQASILDLMSIVQQIGD